MRLLQCLMLTAIAVVVMRLSVLVFADELAVVSVTPAAAQEQADANTEPQEVASNDDSVVIDDQRQNQISGARDTILQRLGERRDALEKRERDLELREQLLAAAESRLKAQLEEFEKFQSGENEVVGPNGKTPSETAKDLVVIYENMKPKDAAKIFDKLSIDILHKLATSMNPRKMSAVLAEMDVKAAERLTVEIALRAASGRGAPTERQLPKIGE